MITQGRTFLGVHPNSKRGVWVSLDQRLRGTYCPGVTGGGKSTYLLGMICQDLRAGRGLLLCDPAGDLVEDVVARAAGLGRADDVLLLDLQSREVAPGINLFACRDPGDPQAAAATAERVMGAFKRVWGDTSWGPRMQDLLGNATLTLVANRGTTLADLPRLLTDAPFRHGLAARVRNEVVAGYWRREYDTLSEAARQQVYAPLTNKVREFLRNPFLHEVVAQPENAVDLGWAIAGRKVVLVRFDPQMEEATGLLGTVLLAQLLEAAFARRALAPAARHPFMVYVDEAHRFATPALVVLLREARKYGIAVTAATQMHALLPADVATALTNVGTVACFQLVPQDARTLAPLYTGAGLPRQRVLDPDPWGRLLRFGDPDPTLVGLAKRLERATAGPAWRDWRLAIEHYLYESMEGGEVAAWGRLFASTPLSGTTAGMVRDLGRRLAGSPLLLRQREPLDVAAALTRLPAHHALVRYREGGAVREALVQTLRTRPLARPIPISPLGVRRSIPSVNSSRPPDPSIPPVDVSVTPGGGDEPPTMFAPR